MSINKMLWCVLAGVSMAFSGCVMAYGPPPEEDLSVEDDAADDAADNEAEEEASEVD